MTRRDIGLISFAQFGSSFAFNFVGAFLPFYIRAVSTYSPAQTLLWTGAIMGSTGLVLALASPFYGALTHRIAPKKLFLTSMFAYTVLFILMGFTTALPLILLLRVLLGASGGVSVIGIIMVSVTTAKNKIVRYFSIYNSSSTFAMLLGPPLGAYAVTVLGYRWAFMGASAILMVGLLLTYLFVTPVAPVPKPTAAASKIPFDRSVLIGALLCAVAQVQLIYLFAVLPAIFQGFHMDKVVALRRAGLLMMLETSAALGGTYLWSFLAERTSARRVISFLLPMSLLCQCLMVFAPGFKTLMVIRIVQAGFTAAVIPLALSLFTSGMKGSVMGFLTSSRFLGNAVGPLMSASILAYSNLSTLYISIAALCLVAFLIFQLSSVGKTVAGTLPGKEGG